MCAYYLFIRRKNCSVLQNSNSVGRASSKLAASVPAAIPAVRLNRLRAPTLKYLSVILTHCVAHERTRYGHLIVRREKDQWANLLRGILLGRGRHVRGHNFEARRGRVHGRIACIDVFVLNRRACGLRLHGRAARCSSCSWRSWGNHRRQRWLSGHSGGRIGKRALCRNGQFVGINSTAAGAAVLTGLGIRA